MNHNPIFINSFENDEQINNIRNQILEFSNDDELCQKFIKNINKFITKHKMNIDLEEKILKKIILDYWYSILNVYKHTYNSTGWSKSTLDDYIICCTRTQELLIFVCSRFEFFKETIFLNDFLKYQDNYYFYLEERMDDFTESHLKIIKLSGVNVVSVSTNYGHNAIDIIDNHYRSTINIQPPKKEVNLLSFYLKLKDYYVKEIFLLSSSENKIEGRNPRGSFGVRTPFEIYETVKIEKLVFREHEAGISEETKKEMGLKRIKTQSPIFDKNIADLINEDFYDVARENSIESKYKRFQISKAISNSITKRNIDLRSNYNFPEFNVFKEFLITRDSKNIYFQVIQLSFFTGFEIKKLLFALLNLDNQLVYKSRQGSIQVKVNKEMFSSFELKGSLAESIKKQECEIFLADEIINIWLNTARGIEDEVLINYLNEIYISSLALKYKTEIGNNFTDFISKNKNRTDSEGKDISIKNTKQFFNLTKSEFSSDYLKKLEKLNILENIVAEIYNNIDEYLKIELRNHPKRIVLSLSSVSRLNLHYFKTFKSSSEIFLLYSRSISRNDATRVGYGTVRDRLFLLENWTEELFLKIYNSSNIISKIVTQEHWIGSPYFLKPGAFKQFIFELTKIKSQDEIVNFNLNMIFLRYGLSLLLATRDYRISCNLSDYSLKLRILTIQEKAKNIFQSKRIIPLCDRAVILIKNFEQLKRDYNISANTPVLLLNDNSESEINSDNINKFLNTLDIDSFKESIEYIKLFVNNLKTNFGRHVVVSSFSIKSLRKEYINAFLNHFSMGTEDQGMFSNIDNQEYIKSIINEMNVLEEEYFIKDIRIGKYEY